ncbi:MAX dimerization protein MGA a isoform X3 [Danio aesculapii]|uniref:MAX dimerization protein MGA a isoform X3 n=1 Tax=Danio aesculapii TaxID=1142201 RepID=UPI0024C0E066|nr:MAX dimerization protein MGA a isoform X3 [Danio aesculapii]
MADTEKQGAMVLHEEGVTAPTLAPPTTTPPSIFVVLKQLQSSDSGNDKAKLMAISEANKIGISSIGSAVTGIQPTSSTFADTNSTTPSENLPADARCRGITVTLDNNNMWNEFHRCKTEMILTKQGRRMFPYCRFRLSGMEPFQNYVLAMDIKPADNCRYKWSGKGWEPNGKAEPHISRLFVHPESPASGLHWMQYPVSFYRLKLCNTLDQEGHIILHSMHRYLPQIHIIPADKVSKDVLILDRPNVVTLSFAQTEFFAVTAYQNLCITQLKIDYNPFAKGFREDAVNARSSKAKNGLSTDETESELKLSKEMTTLNNLKTLFMKRKASVKVNVDQNVPSPTNGEKKVVNGAAPAVDTNVQSLCKKRPSSLAFSDFIKGAHVKVKRLSLENINKTGLATQPSTACTSKQKEAIDISSKTENSLQIDQKDGTVTGDVLKCESTDTSSRMGVLKANEIKKEIDEHSADKNTLILSDQNLSCSDEKKMETVSSLSTEARPEAKIKKTLPHKRPERVPLPLLAKFLKQRRPSLPKPVSHSSLSDSEKSCEPVQTSESASVLMSFVPCVTTNLDSQPAVTSLSQKVTSSTTDASNITSLSTTLSSLSTTVPLIPSETQLCDRFSASPVGSDPFSAPNTTSPSKPNFNPTPDISNNTDAIFTPDHDNTHRSQSDISSDSTCDVHDSCPPTVNTDTVETPVVPSPRSVFDIPSSTDNDMNSYQDITSMPDVAEGESISDCLLDSSTGSCPEFFSEEIPPNTLFTNEDSLSLPLDDPSSPAFSLPSPAPSSPDPFPPSLFCDRPVPPRKALDSFPERLLDCTASSARDPFPLGFFNDRPEPPRQIFDLPDRPLIGTLASRESLSSSVNNGPEHPMETSDLFSQTHCSDRANSLNDLESAASCETAVSDSSISKPTKPSPHESGCKKYKAKQKKVGTLKLGEHNEVFVGPVPVPLQPSLEDVEGQLFVSFMSKKALRIHLGDDDKPETAQQNTDNPDGNNEEDIEKKIEGLEKVLFHDLKFMKNRQVIHPVLQKVGLKLNLLDVTLEIDLQYLGVQLPIPPPALLPEETSSQAQFVSRTGKTSDFTQIKGWRDKFAPSASLSEGVSSTDAGQSNLSAFCSDMLDEYLASEGKLIDERAAALSQADCTPVAYQLPTKSTSYVRTLDSVLKKQVPATITTTTNKVKPTFKSKVENKSKKPLKSGKGKQTKPIISDAKSSLSMKKPQQNKKFKNKKDFKSLSPEKPVVAPVAASNKTPKGEKSGSTPSTCAGGRSPGLPKTLVKLMDVEDGAVWEGRHRSYITEERAAIALATLVTAEGVSTGSPDAIRIIRRRAPPCLNVFCRLGCVCASLVHLRRHHHCGKPQCMLGCSCLRRKVVALKTPKQEEGTADDSEPQGMSEENKAKWRKKNKMRKTYVLTDPEIAPEPAKRVSTLWDRTRGNFDREVLYCPPPPRSPLPQLLSQELQHDLESFLSPSKQKRVEEVNKSSSKDNIEINLTCARSRPFYSNCHDKPKTDDNKHHISQVSTPDIEEGELVPLNLSGPAKRLEMMSECTWTSTDMRNNVMRIVCEHMAQDRLKQPFWIGKYFVKPISKILEEEENGSVEIYKVIISQPVEKKTENEKVTLKEEELKKHVQKSEVKGLPFLSKCCPAGLLKAEKKSPDAPGQIMVNGKPYPQAKLELGHMGALHPANRLAAYITGRICPTVSAITKPLVTSVPSSTGTTVSIVTCTPASTTTSISKSVAAQSPLEKVFSQFVVNQINSQNVSNTSTSHLQPSVPKIVIPSPLLMIGKESGAPSVALSSLKAGLVTQVSESSNSTGGSTTTTTASTPGLTSPTKKTVYITVASRNTGLTNSGPQIKKVVTPTGPPQTSGQKMLLQVVKTADGNTLYRNSNGQLMQLVPLSQIKALKPNLLSQGQPTIIRLPAPPTVTTNKPQGGSATIVTSSIPTTQTLAKPSGTVPVSTSSSMGGKLISLPSSKSVSLSSLPSTLKVVQGFLGQSGTCTLRILPPNTPTSSTILSQSGLTLLKSASSMPPKQDSDKSETNVSFSSQSTEKTVIPVLKQSTVDPAKQNSSDNANVKEKHFNKEPDPEEREIGSDSTELTDDSDLYSDDDQEDASCISASDREEKIEDTDGMDTEKKGYAEMVVDIETIEESAEQNRIAKFRASAHRRNQKRIHDELLEVRVKRVRQERKRRHTLSECFIKLQGTLGLSSKKFEVSRMRILTKANKEVEYLVKLEDYLVEKKAKLQFKKERYIQTLSQLCDKSTESIGLKLNEIISKQKALEAQSKTKEMNPKPIQAKCKAKPKSKPKCKSKPKSKVVDVCGKQKSLAVQKKVKDVPKATYSPSKPIDLSIKKQKSLETTESVPKSTPSVSVPADLDCSKNTLKILDTNTAITTSTPIQPSFNSTLVMKPVSIPSPVKHPPITRERMRPNILSRASSQAMQGSPVKESLLTNVCIPQVLPLMNTMVPCNQIITINNSLQPIGITSVGQQSSTPGVASVSIVPTLSHPLRVENALPMLHPQFIKITNSPVNINTKVDSASLPNISNVISLAENLVVPRKVGEDKPVVQAQPTSVDNQQNSSDDKIPDLKQKTDEAPSKDVSKQSVVEDQKVASVPKSNPEEPENKSPDDSDDPEDENLLSLLDELVLLSQQLNNEDEDQRIAVPGDVQSCSDKPEDPEPADERALSPLFLTLDEDLMSPDSKDEIDIPPKVDDLVKVIFGSDSPSVSSESGVAQSTNASSPHASTCNATGDGLTPPPLLHMKAACEAASGQSANEGNSVTWRPMPKLVPLGLKAQDAGKVINSSVPNLDSSEQDTPQM